MLVGILAIFVVFSAPAQERGFLGNAPPLTCEHMTPQVVGKPGQVGADGEVGDAHVQQRQVRLPFMKSVEISLKSIKVRFFRSVITTMSLVLAVSF